MRAAVILDDFSALAFGSEWNCIAAVAPFLVGASCRDSPVDLLFVESAWNGQQGAMGRQDVGPEHAGPSPLAQLTAWCREQGIPTVFWNKEDPPHYDDFLAAAKLFDFVFTSDATKIEDYVKISDTTAWHVLPFAAQPLIHNPVRPKYGWHDRDVAFGGMYFAEKYPERRRATGPPARSGRIRFGGHGNGPRDLFPANGRGAEVPVPAALR